MAGKQVDPFYRSKAWEAVRLQRLRMDNYTCQFPGCGQLCLGRSRNGFSPHVDHKKPRRDYPELALEVSNLQTLCHVHHGRKTRRLESPRTKPAIGVDGWPIDPE